MGRRIRGVMLKMVGSRASGADSSGRKLESGDTGHGHVSKRELPNCPRVLKS